MFDLFIYLFESPEIELMNYIDLNFKYKLHLTFYNS